jgi:hypothetical protein
MASQSASLRASCAYGMGILLLTSDKQVYGLRAGARHVSRGAAHGAGARGAPCCLRARFSKTRRPGWVPARCPARHGRCLGALSSISASKRAARRSGASRFSARRLGAPPVQARNVVLLSPRLQPVRSSRSAHHRVARCTRRALTHRAARGARALHQLGDSRVVRARARHAPAWRFACGRAPLAARTPRAWGKARANRTQEKEGAPRGGGLKRGPPPDSAHTRKIGCCGCASTRLARAHTPFRPRAASRKIESQGRAGAATASRVRG